LIFKRVDFTEKQMEWAKTRATQIIHDKHTLKEVPNIESSKANGRLAELAFWLDRRDAEHVDQKGFDFLWRRHRVEVKEVSTSSDPNQFLLNELVCSMGTYAYSRIEFCDVIVFYHVRADSTCAWEIGWITPADFKKASQLKPRGSKLGGYTFAFDSRAVTALHLNDMSSFMPELKRRNANDPKPIPATL